MAITHSSSFHCLYLFFSLILFHSWCLNKAAYAYSGGGRGSAKSHHVLDAKSLLTSSTSCSDSFTKGSRRSPTTLRLAHEHGPCAPLVHGHNTTTAAPSTIEILIQDESRVKYIHSKFSKRVGDIEEEKAVPVSPGQSLGTSNFIVKIGFGTPKLDLSVVFDTGSDLTWIQCQPCAGSCYPQQDPIFNPSKSSSYSNISCSAPECSQLRRSGCESSTCLYGVRYGDNSQTIGFFARETLTLTSSDVFPNFQFGCGQNNGGLFGKTAGLLGLGRNKVSFVSQASKQFGGTFSYCLPPRASSTGYLAFGATAKTSLRYTPLVTDLRGPSFYFLKLLGISVANKKLSIQPSVFTSSGTIIDSGTVITRLPPAAYAVLQSAFKQSMSKYPSAQPISKLDTCYDLSGYTNLSIPKVMLHFEGGVDLDQNLSGILIGSSVSQVCLAFIGNSDPSDLAIFGNRQQLGLDVVYDVAAGRIGFGSGACSS